MRNTHFKKVPPAVSYFVITLALVALCLGLCVTPKSNASRDDSAKVSTATLEGRMVVFDDVWDTIQARYYDPEFNGVDWQNSRTTFRPIAAKAANTQEFYEVIRRMLAPLRDAHTRVYSPEEKFDWWSPRFITLGFTMREVEGSPTVLQVDKESQAHRAGIRPGDVLTQIDGLRASEYIARRLKTFDPPSDGSARFRAIANVLEGPAGSSVKVEWKAKEGKTKSAVFTRFWNQKRLGFSSKHVDDFLFVKIDAFTKTVALDFTKAMPKLVEGAKGVILDLRANGGGDAEAMADVASLFLQDGIGLGKFSDRSGASFELQTYLKRLWSSASAVKLPIVVLTSESTSSAAEIMAAALQTERGARVIGATSCGCVLAIRNRHGLPDGGVLDVSEFNYHTRRGVRLEGRGIKPDFVTTIKRSDLYAGRDQTLELAKSVLKNSIRK
jgi:carboxyl-terminal processing protease